MMTYHGRGGKVQNLRSSDHGRQLSLSPRYVAAPAAKKGAASDFIARKALARVVPMHRLYPCSAAWRRLAWQKCSRVNILVLCCCNDFNLEYENNKNAKNTKKHNVAGNNDPSRECACVFYSFPQNPTTGNTKEGAILTACVMLTNLYSARTSYRHHSRNTCTHAQKCGYLDHRELRTNIESAECSTKCCQQSHAVRSGCHFLQQIFRGFTSAWFYGNSAQP